MPTALELAGVAKTFTMHLQGGVRLSVVSGVGFSVMPGECAVLVGPSGAGKSSILKMIFGSYRCDRGQIMVRRGTQRIDIAGASARHILALRKDTVGYVSQFLRAVPRVPTLDVVAEPLVARGVARDAARKKAAELLRRLHIPGPLWGFRPPRSPAASSSGSISPAVSCRIFRCCCWMSRPHRSTSPTARW